MVDGVLLLVDASEGPLPQTRFVLRKALEAAPAGGAGGQQGRPARRPHRRGGRRGLRAVPRPRRRRGPDRVPDPLRQRPGRLGRADRPRTSSARPDLEPLFEAIIEHVPAPVVRPTDAPLQALVTNLDASPYLGRLALCRVHNGTIAQGPAGGLVPRSTAPSSGPRSPSCYVTEALDRVPARRRPARATSSPSPASPRSRSARRWPTPTTRAPLPRDHRRRAGHLDDHRHQHLAAGRQATGTKLTARLVKDRLDRELVGNVSLRVLPHRAARHLGGPGPRRAAAGRAGRDHAPGGLRADRGQAPGRHPRDRRQASTSRWSGCRSTCPRSTSARSPSCSPLRKGRMDRDGQPRHRLGAASTSASRPAA